MNSLLKISLTVILIFACKQFVSLTIFLLYHSSNTVKDDGYSQVLPTHRILKFFLLKYHSGAFFNFAYPYSFTFAQAVFHQPCLRTTLECLHTFVKLWNPPRFLLLPLWFQYHLQTYSGRCPYLQASHSHRSRLLVLKKNFGAIH